MSSTINPVITDAGLAAAIAADGAGLSLQITHVALGAGSYTPTGLETALADRRETVTIASGTVGVGGTFSVAVVFPQNTGTAYDAKEIGFYAGNPASGGTLFAVHSSATSIVFRSTLDFLAQFSLGLSAVPAGSVTVVIDPAAAILHALIQEHEDKPDPHPQYTPETDFNALKARLDARIGTVFHHAAATAPASALKCNGAAVSRTTYAALFAIIGTTYGAGNGSTTFNLPELRGEFIRGLDDGRGVDAGRGIGTSQNGQVGNHNHPYRDRYYIENPNSVAAATNKEPTSSLTNSANFQIGTNGTDQDNTMFLYQDSTTGDNSGAETRPRNVALLACIWFA